MLKLEELKKETGVFISEADFQVIMLDYIMFMDIMGLEDSNEAEQKYIQYWIKEQEMYGTILETADSKIKYYCSDASQDEPITTLELLEQFDKTSFKWETLCRKHWKVLKDILKNKTKKYALAVIKDILSHETMSYEQRYILETTVKNRIFELLNE